MVENLYSVGVGGEGRRVGRRQQQSNRNSGARTVALSGLVTCATKM